MTKKPRTALASLLDSVADLADVSRNISGAGVVSPIVQREDISDEKNEIFASALVTQSSKKITAEETREFDQPVLKFLDPKLCAPWKFADRPEDEMGNIDELSEAIANFGQQQPILVRPVINNSETAFEIIFGNRRWRACKKRGLKVLAIVKNVTNQEAALYQKEENENREDLSDLARAKSFKALLDTGIFISENELSKSLGISKQNLNDLMAFNRIPQNLVDAIPNFKAVPRKVVAKLAALSKDERILNVLIKLAPKIGTKEINSSNIELFINKALDTKNIKQLSKQIQVRNNNGSLMFILKQANDGKVNVVINKNYHEKYDIEEIKKAIFNVLNKANV